MDLLGSEQSKYRELGAEINAEFNRLIYEDMCQYLKDGIDSNDQLWELEISLETNFFGEHAQQCHQDGLWEEARIIYDGMVLIAEHSSLSSTRYLLERVQFYQEVVGLTGVEKEYHKILEQAKKEDNFSIIAEVYRGLGHLAYTLNDYSMAYHQWQKALEIYKYYQHPNETILLWQMGLSIYRTTGNYLPAMPYFEACLQSDFEEIKQVSQQKINFFKLYLPVLLALYAFYFGGWVFDPQLSRTQAMLLGLVGATLGLLSRVSIIAYSLTFILVGLSWQQFGHPDIETRLLYGTIGALVMLWFGWWLAPRLGILQDKLRYRLGFHQRWKWKDLIRQQKTEPPSDEPITDPVPCAIIDCHCQSQEEQEKRLRLGMPLISEAHLYAKLNCCSHNHPDGSTLGHATTARKLSKSFFGPTVEFQPNYNIRYEYRLGRWRVDKKFSWNKENFIHYCGRLSCFIELMETHGLDDIKAILQTAKQNPSEAVQHLQQSTGHYPTELVPAIRQMNGDRQCLRHNVTP